MLWIVKRNGKPVLFFEYPTVPISVPEPIMPMCQIDNIYAKHHITDAHKFTERSEN